MTKPRLPRLSAPSLPPRPSLPRITRTHVRTALPYALAGVQLLVLLAPLAAPALAPVHAARLLTASRYASLLLALARR